jgi:hypothetical protein
MIRKIIGILALVAALVLGSAGVAKADGIALDNFTYTVGGQTFQWQLPASPTPTADNASPPFGFILSNVSVTDKAGTTAIADIGFYANNSFIDNGGGFDFQFGDLYIDAFGDQLYSGFENSPTFILGTYKMTERGSIAGSLESDNAGLPGKLVISSAPVPEPSTLILLIVGSLGVLLMARRRG